MLNGRWAAGAFGGVAAGGTAARRSRTGTVVLVASRSTSPVTGPGAGQPPPRDPRPRQPTRPTATRVTSASGRRPTRVLRNPRCPPPRVAAGTTVGPVAETLWPASFRAGTRCNGYAG